MAGISNDKLRALDSAMRQIEKDFGKGSIMRLGEASAKMNVETIPTGALSLDIALGVGGIPRGRVVEIYGPESSGKTTVALHMIAEAQKMGGYAAFIDAEHALCAAAPLISSSSTLWQRWCPGRKSKGRWVTAMWVCRPAS